MRKTIKNIREWLYWNAPIVTTRRKIFHNEKKHDAELKKAWKEMDWILISYVISSLLKLRENAWDKSRLDGIVNILKDKFGVTHDHL